MSTSLIVRDMQPEDDAFVGSCTHVDETDEWTASCRRRVPWLRTQHEHGLRVKVALVDGTHAGFLYAMPVEIVPWGPVGHGLLAIQCLTVKKGAMGRGVGRALVEAAEAEARDQRRKGIVVIAFYHDFWFMPGAFFEHCGFTVVKRSGNAAILWKPFDTGAVAPDFLERRYDFVPVPGKVAIDLFWNRSCLTSDTEAERVREVAAEFGRAVELREYCADDPAVRSRHGVFRAIFINGTEVGWGYEAPKDGLREAIHKAMAEDDRASDSPQGDAP